MKYPDAVIIRESEYDKTLRAFRSFVPRVMGTKLEMLALGIEEDTAQELWLRMTDDVAMLSDLFDRFKPESEVSRLNAATPFESRPISDTLREAIALSISYNKLTKGLFDITRGRASGLRLDAANGTLSMDAGCTLDFGGFAKGYALKRMKAMLEDAAVENVIVNFGDSTILGHGRHPLSNGWPVSIVHPFSHTTLDEIILRDETLSTSGNAPAYSGHIIDPRSGKKIGGSGLTTVLSPDPLDAEILSTAATVANSEEVSYLSVIFPNANITKYD